MIGPYTRGFRPRMSAA